ADYPEALLLGEAASANVNLAADYTAPNNHLLDSVITFRYFPEDDHGLDPRLPAQFQPKDLDWLAFKRIQAVWQQTLADVSLPVLYWNNHDMPRLATARAKTPTQARSLAMLMYLQRGLPIIYYGEELGLKNLLFTSADQFHDEAAGDFIKRAQVLGKSRDETLQMVSSAHKLPARGPMPWTSEPGGGFSTGRPWLTGERLDRANVEDELNDPGSTLNFYRRLLALKKRALFQTERFYLRATGPDSYVYQRDLGGASVIVAVALGDKETKVRIPRGYTQEELVAGRYRLEDGELLLSPFAGVVLSKES
ncbi:alpha-glucosidase, partial [Lactobacillus sp. XV13L]|nr:alpha-glucosidase [Lactobacillus sp. XV13L]